MANNKEINDLWEYEYMETEMCLPHKKRGYLSRDFNFFNLCDTKQLQIEAHYHDFHKVVIFLSGNVTYCIEGVAYQLKPWDILLIHHAAIHKPVIDITVPYKRMILWVSPSFLRNCHAESDNLLTCFELAYQQKSNLLSMSPDMLRIVKTILEQMDAACRKESFGNQILLNSLLLQFIVYLNRMALNRETGVLPAGIMRDETICNILQYIDSHLTQDLSIEKLAAIFYLSKYHLMRKFKYHTGYSIHNYVLQKRLIRANQMLQAGYSVTMAWMESGFHDYSNFTRSFKKMFGVSPKQHHNLGKSESSQLYNEVLR
ncbi:hypothetical protein P22_0931 [Propionispora sp. 2/2-37]|uniref:AraC family transcriptional regulator n=1 Tax=Propionispora sp. 2/2-37 TaxID=1677858 RepID=UPI0006C255E5|nr:AraC family transcriptional regulator [Propionispora sp. 2/2-37]CUH94865.1 hypothetical protein P22_0931 [Propionispora sp. 2/2-37]